MKILIKNNLSSNEFKKLLVRPAINFEESIKISKAILDDVKINGLQAVLSYAEKFDGIQDNNIIVSESEINNSVRIDKKVKEAIDTAYENIKKFHEAISFENYELNTMVGVKCRLEYRPINNVGIYIPGGTAVLPSTMLMLGVPAQIAGVKRIVACTPAKNGKVNDPVLYAAYKCGVKEIYKVGGAQAVALMAYGVEGINKVDKIFGPGNQYVTAAKMLVSNDPNGCSIDMPAGPSEVLIVADEKANPSFVAADLLSQAEHGADSLAVLVSTSVDTLEKTIKELYTQLEFLPRRKYALESISKSFALKVNTLEEAFEFSNNFAPEHLIIHANKAERFIKEVKNAGSVFVGEYSPESAGDYASGTNHSLPTYGFAKSIGGVSVMSFMKTITFQQLTEKGLVNLSNAIINLAEEEGLAAHANAVKIRLKK